jgi:hypothetical protein
MEHLIFEAMSKELIFLFLLLFGCSPRYSIDEIPMYGNKPKNEFQRKDDSLFIIEETKIHSGQRNASVFYSETGWRWLYYSGVGWSIPFYKHFNEPASVNMAMKVLNRAWLLDSLNANAYWGMATIVANRDKNHEYAEELMEKAIQCDSTNIKIWFDYGMSNMEAAHNVKAADSIKIFKYRDKGIMAFQKVINSNADADIKELAKSHLTELQLIK